MEVMDDRKSLVFAAVLILLVAVLFQGSRGLWEPDEGTFCAVAAEMYDRGDLLMPTLHGKPYPEKPPLMYWGMIAGMKVLGRNEWGERIFYSFCFAACAALTGLLAASMWSRREGILAAVMYATMIVPFVAGNTARPDGPLAVGVTLALYCFWKSLGSQRVALWKLLMCASFGIAFLGKGPAALVFAAPMFVYLVAQRKVISYFLTPWAVVGAAIFALIGLSWYYYMVKTDPRILTYFWDNEVHGRLVSAKYRRNPGLLGALTTYGPVLLCGPLPWAFFWPNWIRISAPKFTTVKWLRENYTRPRALLIATWIIVPTVVMCLASSKLPLYLLPIFPAFALATARGWTLISPESATDARMRKFAAWFAVLLVAAKCGATYFPSEKDSRRFWNDMQTMIPPNTQHFVAIDQDLNGLEFYSKIDVVEATNHVELFPAFVPRILLDDELKLIAEHKTTCVIISNEKNKKNLEKMKDLLKEYNIPFDAVPMPFKRKLLICFPVPQDTTPRPEKPRDAARTELGS